MFLSNQRSDGHLIEYRSTKNAGLNAIELSYRSNGDDNDVFYYLGTNGRTAAWNNPQTSGKIAMSTNKTFYSTDMSLSDLVDRTSVKDILLGYQQGLPTLVTVDLKTYKLKPDRYSIQVGWGNQHPRNWSIDGFADNGNWVPLRTHTNDASLTANRSWGTYSIQSNDHYRQFRLNQFGPTEGGYDGFTIGKWAMYGSLIRI